MVRVSGPAMSLEASGSLAGTLVFSRWKGRPYARELVTPTNPKSASQVGVRAMFKWLSQQWASLSAPNKATWEDRADNSNISPFDAYMAANLMRWRSFKGPSKADPYTADDDVAIIGTTVATAGVRNVTLSIPITTANDGWGVAIFRSASSSFTSGWANLIGVVTQSGTTTLSWIDSPLAAGTYYYNFRSLTIAGVIGDQGTERSATVA